MTGIKDIFAKSPFDLLQQHIDIAHDCVVLLGPLFAALQSSKQDEAEAVYEDIVVKETSADELKAEVRLTLSKGVMLPVQHQDVLRQIRVQDRLANKARDIAGISIGRRLQVPETVLGTFDELVRLAIDSSDRARIAVSELDELLETGFKGPERKLVESMLDSLNDVESDMDRMEIELRAELFKIEKDLHPLDAMFLYRIVDHLGNLGNEAQSVGASLHMMISR